jgi:hypothetical protein
MTRETFEKAYSLDNKISDLQMVKGNIINTNSLAEIERQADRAGIEISELNFDKIKIIALDLIDKKLQAALKELETL